MDLLFEVDRYPRAGFKIDGSGLTVQGGGPVPNVVIGLRRLGHRTALITAMGNDLIGRLGMEELESEGVDTRFVVTKKGSSDTAVGLIERGSGQRTMVLNRTIGVTPRDVVVSRLPRPNVVHLDGRDMPACMKLARWGRRIGATICFDIGSVRNDVSEIFPLVDHLVVADAFAMPFTKARTARRAVDFLRKLCPGAVVVTEGIRGSIGWERGRYIKGRAYKVRTVDATGAGDAFHTGYIYGVLHGADLEERLKLGAAVAALKCTRMGARAGIPNLRQLQRFLKGKPRRYA
jgi:sugar/nucleoside kinase (ribokinase family)